MAHLPPTLPVCASFVNKLLDSAILLCDNHHMSAVLKNRQSQIPNGFRMEIPELKWKSLPFASFNSICSSVLQIVRANPELSREKGWPTDVKGVEDWVDQTNAHICEVNGWKDYITGTRDVSPPLFPPPAGAHPSGGLPAAVVGARTLVEWFGAGGNPVDKSQAEARAAVCAACEFNRPGDMSNWFTRAVSEAIRTKMGLFRGLNLTTTRDDRMGVCDVCSCALKLKLHIPIVHIKNEMPTEVSDALPQHCWIVKEKVSANADIPETIKTKGN
jgi:hypothetical protein